MILACDSCKQHQHDECAQTVRAFIEPDGPDTYLCQCHCARSKRERREADRKVLAVVGAYERRYGAEALGKLLREQGTD